jgi:hypothetical protein
VGLSVAIPGAASPLGNYTKSAVASAASRDDRFGLQDVAALIARPEERVRVCLRCRSVASGRVSVVLGESGSAHYSGLQVCGSVWACPVCSAKISEHRRGELEQAVASAVEQGLTPALASITFSHSRLDDVAWLQRDFSAAWRYMTGTRAYRKWALRWQVSGTVKALEVTWGRANGWHPHCHVLFFFYQEVTGDTLAACREGLWRCWSSAVEHIASPKLRMVRARMADGSEVRVADPGVPRSYRVSAEHGVDLRISYGAVADYVAKFGRESERRPWGVEDELTKARSKRHLRETEAGAVAAWSALPGSRFTPFDFLRAYSATGAGEWVSLWRQYTAAFFGRRQLMWSPGLRGILGLVPEVSDEVLAVEAPEGGVLVCHLERPAWSAVIARGSRSFLLRLAEVGGIVAVVEYVEGLGVLDAVGVG